MIRESVLLCCLALGAFGQQLPFDALDTPSHADLAPPHYACGDVAGTAINFDQFCDGVMDCPDGKDELNCPNAASDQATIAAMPTEATPDEQQQELEQPQDSAVESNDDESVVIVIAENDVHPGGAHWFGPVVEIPEPNVLSPLEVQQLRLRQQLDSKKEALDPPTRVANGALVSSDPVEFSGSPEQVQQAAQIESLIDALSTTETDQPVAKGPDSTEVNSPEQQQQIEQIESLIEALGVTTTTDSPPEDSAELTPQVALNPALLGQPTWTCEHPAWRECNISADTIVQCVRAEQMCDGRVDCVDGSDEAYCSPLDMQSDLDIDSLVINTRLFFGQYDIRLTEYETIEQVLWIVAVAMLFIALFTAVMCCCALMVTFEKIDYFYVSDPSP